jgi:hypothetical protein
MSYGLIVSIAVRQAVFGFNMNSGFQELATLKQTETELAIENAFYPLKKRFHHILPVFHPRDALCPIRIDDARNLAPVREVPQVLENLGNYPV